MDYKCKIKVSLALAVWGERSGWAEFAVSSRACHAQPPRVDDCPRLESSSETQRDFNYFSTFDSHDDDEVKY